MSETDTSVTSSIPTARVRNAPKPGLSGGKLPSPPEVPATVTASGKPTLGLVLFGRDAAGKRRAAYFPADKVVGVERAAGLMGLQVFRLTDPHQKARAVTLPKGKLFASGRALVPLVKDAVIDAVFAPKPAVTAAAAEGQNGTAAETGDLLQPDAGVPVASRAAIVVGSLVLVGEVYPLCGWYEATVVAAPGDDLFTLRWRDWPDDPLVARRRGDLALLPPNTLAAAGVTVDAEAGGEH